MSGASVGGKVVGNAVMQAVVASVTAGEFFRLVAGLEAVHEHCSC